MIVDNRIKGDIGWMLEPWKSAPPIDFEVSFSPICVLLLHRLGCPESQQTVNVGSKDGSVPFACECGAFQSGSSRIQELICDKVSEGYLGGLPVFEEPLTLSVELSLALLLLCGQAGAVLTSLARLPPAVGALLAGFALQNLLAPSLLKESPGGPRSTPLGEARAVALLVLLLRAGLAVGPRLRPPRPTAAAAAALAPFAAEFLALLLAAALLLGWRAADAGILAAVLSAASPVGRRRPGDSEARRAAPDAADMHGEAPRAETGIGSDGAAAAGLDSDAAAAVAARVGECGAGEIGEEEEAAAAAAAADFLLAIGAFSACAAPGQVGPGAWRAGRAGEGSMLVAT